MIVIIAALLVPLIKNSFTKTKIAVNNDIQLFLSDQCGEFFGKEITENMITQFEKKNPGIKIKIADDSEEPDILIFNDGDFNILVSESLLAELNSFTNYDSGNLQLAVPLVSFINLLFYNIDILSAAGFDSPPKTREQYTGYAKTISRGESGAAGASLSLNPDDHQALSRDIFSWIWAGGGAFWTDDSQVNQRPSFNTRSMINDITFLETLNRDGSLANGVFDLTGKDYIEQFAEGKIALMIASAQAIPYLREKMGDNAFGISTVPAPASGGIYQTGLSAIYAAISANSENPEQAWNFLAFLAENSSLFCSELKAVPGIISSIIPGDYVKNDLFYSKAWEIFQASRIAEMFTGKPGAVEYEAIFLEELRFCFERSRTAVQTAATIERRWGEVTVDTE